MCLHVSACARVTLPSVHPGVCICVRALSWVSVFVCKCELACVYACSRVPCMFVCGHLLAGGHVHVNFRKSTNKVHVPVRVHLWVPGFVCLSAGEGRRVFVCMQVGRGDEKLSGWGCMCMWHACPWAFVYDTWRKGVA